MPTNVPTPKWYDAYAQGLLNAGLSVQQQATQIYRSQLQAGQLSVSGGGFMAGGGAGGYTAQALQNTYQSYDPILYSNPHTLRNGVTEGDFRQVSCTIEWYKEYREAFAEASLARIFQET